VGVIRAKHVAADEAQHGLQPTAAGAIIIAAADTYLFGGQ
jgi:hypothetical protein